MHKPVTAVEVRLWGPRTGASDTAIKLGRQAESARVTAQGKIDTNPHAHTALAQVIQFGTNAWSAQAKSTVLWSPETNKIRAGQFHGHCFGKIFSSKQIVGYKWL